MSSWGRQLSMPMKRPAKFITRMTSKINRPGGRPEFDSTGGYAYIDGEYQITVTVPNQVMWVSFNEDFEDTESTIDARPVKSSEDGSFPVPVLDKDNFYGLEVMRTVTTRSGAGRTTVHLLTYWEYSELIHCMSR